MQRRFSPALQSEFRGILLDILGVAGRRWSGSLFPLTPEYIAAGDVWITTGTDGQIAGFVGAGTPRCAGAHLDLNKLVHRSGGGIGRALLRGPTRHGSAARTG